MEIAIVFVIGIFIGMATLYFASRARSVGTLRIDTSDSDGPYLFLELSKEISYIWRKKYVTLKVNTNSYISHK